jgi:hypothetical protein
MPSSRYVPTTSGNRIKGFSSTGKSSDLVGGAVPLLLKNSILKTPIKGGALNEPSKANIMVGTITSSFPTNVVSKTVGGELLNSIAKLRFGKGAKRKEAESNIKFIF